MSIRYSAPGVPGGEVSPGAGSTGFTSNAVAVVNASGQLQNSTFLSAFDHATSGRFVVASSNNPGLTTAAGAIQVGLTSGITLGIGPDRIQARTSVGGAGVLLLNPSGGAIQFGTSAQTGKVTFASTINQSTEVGGAGAAAALPATPQVYIKVIAPDATTVYIPAYLST